MDMDQVFDRVIRWKEVMWFVGSFLFAVITWAIRSRARSKRTKITALAAAALILTALILFFDLSISLGDDLNKFVRAAAWLVLMAGIVFFGIILFILIHDSGQRERICVLLPLADSDDDTKQDIQLILDGLRRALDEFCSETHLPGIDFRFIAQGPNHRVGEAQERAIAGELRRGTRHFICTMSTASENLAPIFISLKKTFYKDAVLLCTVAGKADFAQTSKEDLVYRIFPNVNAEMERAHQYLASYSGLWTAIYMDTMYGIGLMSALKEKVDRQSWIDGVKLPNNQPDHLEAQVRMQFERIKKAQFILIAGTWIRVKRIFDILKNIDSDWMQSRIFIVSTAFLTHIDSRGAIADEKGLSIWRRCPVVRCCPKKANGTSFEGSVVQCFVTISLIRMIATITNPEYAPGNFHGIWKTLTNPSWLNINWDNADPEIPIAIDVNQRARQLLQTLSKPSDS